MRGLLRFCLHNRMLVLGVTLLCALGSIYVSPFDLGVPGLGRDPVPVDAIPDLGENQQIVFTRWAGRSPQDVQDQITYPLSQALMGLPRVRTIRGYSYFGYSSLFIVFEEGVDFYWARARILEKIAALPARTIPKGTQPTLGPDATGLGQVFWYTLDGAGLFDLQELRSLQDHHIRYALQGVKGVSEVASVGGYVREYQVDVDPDALRSHDVRLAQVIDAVRKANEDVGAGTLEINRVEYMVRGIGSLSSVSELAAVAVTTRDGVPVLLSQVADVHLGPATRRGVLDRAGTEAVGGVVVVRQGENPLAVIERVHAKIAEISAALPTRVDADGVEQRVRIVPFYDRTMLIQETLGTLAEALTDELLVTLVVVVALVAQLNLSLLVSSLLPLAVGMTFLLMRVTGVDANIMSLAGIAIAIGTMVDMGIVMGENIMMRLNTAPPDKDTRSVVLDAATEVASAVGTSVATTVVSFLPVFTLTGAEGRLFRPLAYTKTFALLTALAFALAVLPPVAAALFRRARPRADGVAPKASGRTYSRWALNTVTVLGGIFLLGRHWAPLGTEVGLTGNLVFVGGLVGLVLGVMAVFQRAYPRLLSWCLAHKALFALMPLSMFLFGGMSWLGMAKMGGWMPEMVKESAPFAALSRAFPGMGEAFMPPFDEGSFLLMPTTMPHAGQEEALEILQLQDRAIANIPEVSSVVGKIGRAESALDPAPLSMVETVINYVPEYGAPDPETGDRPRQWRDHIRTPDDIWDEILEAASVPGATSAPMLQPIAARLVMLQSGMRAPMGVKIKGPSLEALDAAAQQIEAQMRLVKGLKAVSADRVVGKPYLEFHIDRRAIQRYGVRPSDVQAVLRAAVGGQQVTTTVEGPERYGVRVRYARAFRDSLESLKEVLVPTASGTSIPLVELADLRFTRGPMVIKSEDSFLVAYVLFDKEKGLAEVDAVAGAQAALSAAQASGALKLPAGVSYQFAGTYEAQAHAAETLRVVVPISLVLIFLLLHFQFGRASTAGLVFSGVAVAWAGGFVLLWLFAQPGFLDFEVFGRNMRDVFNVGPNDLSVAVWVGFIALFGVATDDGVVMATYLDQRFEEDKPSTVEEIRASVLVAGSRRVGPCLMTTATTILALLPVIASQGKGSDVMAPMALPTLGGMTFELMTLFVVPVGYAALKEWRVR